MEVFISKILRLFQQILSSNPLMGRMLTNVFFHTNCKAIINHWIVFVFVRFLDYDQEATASLTGQQRMLTSPCHLLLPEIFSRGPCMLCSCFLLSTGLLIFNTVCYHHINITVSGFYYGINAGVTPAAAQTFCQSIGLRLAVLETLAEYEEARAFLMEYDQLWG